jgi:hypothetical protein
VSGSAITQSQVVNLTTDLANRAVLDGANAFTVGAQTINTGAVGNKGLVVKGALGQTANLLEIQDSTGGTALLINSANSLLWGQTGSLLSGTNGRILAITNSTAIVPLTVRGAAGQSANLQEWQTSDSVVHSGINASGFLFVGGSSSAGGQFGITAESATNRGMVIKGAASQSANLQEWQSSTGSTALSVNSAGLLTGTRAFAINQSNSGEAMFVLKGAASQTGDQLAVRDSSANTIAGFSATGRLYSGVSGSGQTYLGGLNLGSVNTVATQLGVIAGAATTVGAVVRGAASASADLTQWQNSGGTALAFVSAAGVGRFENVGTLNGFGVLGYNASGGHATLVRANAAMTNPGANTGRLYFRDGTNANTLKLVVRAGAAGAETTILDNIPT